MGSNLSAMRLKLEQLDVAKAPVIGSISVPVTVIGSSETLRKLKVEL